MLIKNRQLLVAMRNLFVFVRKFKFVFVRNLLEIFGFLIKICKYKKKVPQRTPHNKIKINKMPRKKAAIPKSTDKEEFYEKLDPIINRLVTDQGSEQDLKIANQIFEECFCDAIIKSLSYFEKYKNTENLEIEFRLGFIEDNTFDTDIQEEFYKKIQDVLESSSKFKKESYITKDVFNSKGLRKSVDQRTKRETIIKKIKLCSLDFSFEGTPFDIRISFSQENPRKTFSGKDITHTRHKNRKSFIYDNWNYDLTTVSTEINSVKEEYHEVEIETNKPLNEIYDKTRPYEFIHSSFLKIRDLIRMCEDDENSSKVVFIREK